MQQIIFILLALGTLGAAVMVVTSQNLMRSALWLILAFFGIAGIFVMLDAEFLAVTQILIYVGAIAMLIIFAIMLTRGMMDPKQPRFNQQWGVVGGFAALLFVSLGVPGHAQHLAGGRCRRAAGHDHPVGSGLRRSLCGAVRSRVGAAGRGHDRRDYCRERTGIGSLRDE